ncbi:excise [Mycobacterium phage Mendokysei]|uniref:Excise n=1 Tax=Mycobacterium phage Mendokysei TaxID=2099637 RepID=A0A2P1CG84_9CAUD|nr:excise [Mycobacterium phage Mendokysei]AVJ50252.1 excise [Mycobacterium phage Mendokysei]
MRAPTRLIYDEESAAELLSTTPRRLAELRRAGEIVAVRDGRAYKYRADDLQAYVNSLPTYEPGQVAS